ncbi:Coatomer subunit beta' [Panicum miliaceum]|uniref:Coatomer subunit beta n=1 Tax=Panicum miliaceum TaxID=4540 RepID=A0A3L6PFK0_PANMI|nr:Coatomer subunit beta' [Panicum miliaceum]
METCRKFERKSATVNSVDVHPTEPWVLAALDSGYITVWDFRNKSLVKNLQVSTSTESINHISISPSGNTFASGCQNGTAKIWSLDSMSLMLTLDAHNQAVNWVELFTADNKCYLITCSGDCTVKVANGEILSFPVKDVIKCDLYPKVRKTFKPEFSADCIFGGLLLSASGMNLIRFYDWNDCELVHHFNVDMNVRSVNWAEDNSLIAINCDSTFYILNYKKDVGTSAAQPRLRLLGTLNERVRTAAWARDSYVYINSSWCLKCCRNANVTEMYILNGMHRLPRSMALIGYHRKDNKIYLADKDVKLLSYRVDPGSNESIMPVASLPKKIGLTEVRESMKAEDDFEFSWKDQLLNGQYILPAVRDQGEASSCVFQLVSAAAEIEKMKTAAQENPPRTTDIRFSASSFVADYEKMSGPIPLDSENRRLRDGLKLFESQGVHAEGGGAAPVRYKISSSRYNVPMSLRK